MATDEFLKEHSYIISLPENPDVEIASPSDWTRAFVVRTGEFPYESLGGGIVYTKGVMPSGSSHGGYAVSKPYEPWGFFGKKSADLDMEVSNELLRSGARVGLPLGYIEMNRELIERIRNQWKYDTRMRDYLIKELKKVYSNGDSPVLYFRVGGVPVRIGTIENTLKTPMIRQAASQTARVIVQEATYYPDSFRTYFDSDLEAKDATDILAQLAKDPDAYPIEWSHAPLLKKMFLSMALRNAHAIKKYYESAIDRRDSGMTSHTPKLYGNIGSRMSKRHDTDVSLITQDFELALTASGNNKDEIKSLCQRNMREMANMTPMNICLILKLLHGEPVSMERGNPYSPNALSKVVNEYYALLRKHGIFTI